MTTEIQEYSYEQGRDLIRSGDMISFFASHEELWIHRLTTVPVYFFSGSQIYHSGIAIWMTTDSGDRRLMVCEGVGVGRRLVNASHFSNRKMEIHKLPVEYDASAVVNYMLDGIGKPYAFGSIIAIGFTEFFGMKPSTSNPNAEVCSESAALAWQAGGFKFPQTTRMSPGKLRNVVKGMGIQTFTLNPDNGE